MINTLYFRFSVNPAENVWDEKQWEEDYTKSNIPQSYYTYRLSKMFERINAVIPLIKDIVNL